MKIVKIVTESYKVGGWVAPSGDFTETDVHIADILRNPPKFGLTKSYIDDLYDRYGETQYAPDNSPTEGEAREELILTVLQNGWIRYRRYKNYFSVNVWKLDRNTVERLKSWIRAMSKHSLMGKYDELRISELASDSMRTVEADDLLRNRVHSISESVEHVKYPKVARLSSVAAQPDIEPLLEVKLSRVYSYFNGEVPVGIVSAYREGTDPETNARNSRELANTLRSAGLGFVWVDGAWKGEDGEVASEVSIMVTGKLKDGQKLFALLSDASKKYNQDAFIFKGPGNAPVKLYDKFGQEMMSFNKVSLDSIADMFTRLRSGSHAGRSFVIEGTRTPIGFMGRMSGLRDRWPGANEA